MAHSIIHLYVLFNISVIRLVVITQVITSISIGSRTRVDVNTRVSVM